MAWRSALVRWCARVSCRHKKTDFAVLVQHVRLVHFIDPRRSLQPALACRLQRPSSPLTMTTRWVGLSRLVASSTSAAGMTPGSAAAALSERRAGATPALARPRLGKRALKSFANAPGDAASRCCWEFHHPL
jgi:hypothetical protein